MNKEELLNILLEDEYSIDPEAHHAQCDDALLEYINDKQISKAFKLRTKWYA